MPSRVRGDFTAPVLLLSALLIAVCGLVYELLAGALASYLVGDSVTMFSTVIGVYLSAMGLGSWLSGKLEGEVAATFVQVELGVALVGGCAAPALFLAFAHQGWFKVALYGLVALIGTLVGLEVPLLLRVLKGRYAFKDLIARVLTVDYLGALVASLLFPLVLVPKLGMVRTGLAFGVLNGLVGLGTTFLLQGQLRHPGRLRASAAVVLALLGALLWQADRLTSLAEDGLYADEVVFARSTPYQRIVLTQGRASFQLFLNGNLQFSSADEHRYHEALVHPALGLAEAPRKVVVLGGGDGLALRELLKDARVEAITLVDLDPAMTRLGTELPLLRKQNHDAFHSPKVTVVNEDAALWLEQPRGPFDVAIIDFPDPNNFALGKLYTTRFYRLLKASLAPGAPVVVQSTSPMMARRSFWCIATTLEAAGFFTRAYHVPVPSFGEWGFVLAKDAPFPVPTALPPGAALRYLTPQLLPTMFVFSADMDRVPAEVNRLDNQVLVQYYESEWKRWN